LLAKALSGSSRRDDPSDDYTGLRCFGFFDGSFDGVAGSSICRQAASDTYAAFSDLLGIDFSLPLFAGSRRSSPAWRERRLGWYSRVGSHPNTMESFVTISKDRCAVANVANFIAGKPQNKVG